MGFFRGSAITPKAHWVGGQNYNAVMLEEGLGHVLWVLSMPVVGEGIRVIFIYWFSDTLT